MVYYLSYMTARLLRGCVTDRGYLALMKQKIFSLAYSFALLILLLAQGAVGASQDKAFFWEVSGEGEALYLLGSIHFANTGFYPLNARIESAFAESDNLVVEVDISSADMGGIGLMIKQGSYPPGETIKDHLSPHTYQQLSRYLASQQLSLELLSQYKPGMLILTLTSMKLMQMGLSPDQGVDLHLLNRARGNKNILELETLEEQLKLLLDLGDGEAYLQQSLAEFDQYPQMVKVLIEAWQRGDTRQLQELLIDKPLRDYPETRPVFERMFTQRNLRMADKIKGFLSQQKHYFVVVGAGHLIGEQGIIALLQNAGYRVRRL